MPRVALIWSRRSTHDARSGLCGQAQYNCVSFCFIREPAHLAKSGIGQSSRASTLPDPMRKHRRKKER